MKNKINIIERTFLFAWPYMVLFSLVIFLITGNFDNYVLSFLLGALSSLMMNSLQYRIMKHLYAHNPEAIRSRQIMIYTVKLLFFGLILFITHSQNDWNVWYAFAGLLTYRIVMFPVALIWANKDDDGDGDDE